MQTAIRILVNTPVWVFPLLAYLIWQGWRSMRPRTQPVWRMLIVTVSSPRITRARSALLCGSDAMRQRPRLPD